MQEKTDKRWKYAMANGQEDHNDERAIASKCATDSPRLRDSIRQGCLEYISGVEKG